MKFSASRKAENNIEDFYIETLCYRDALRAIETAAPIESSNEV
jgi:hypothetical protein